jgi:glycosyltransferase involved in cell wall biosynthesis
VAEAEVRALRGAGHDVRLYATRTDDLARSVLYPLSSALRVATGMGRSPKALIERDRPDVVHVHNLFPGWASRWTGPVQVPLVTTIHNFRPLCANGILFRDGQPCTLCPDGKRYSGVRYKCYRDSRLASLPLAIANRHGPLGNPLLRSAQRVIVLSELARQIYIGAGVPQKKLMVWPNFLPLDLDPGWGPAAGRGERWLFVGRISREKGILRLVQKWPDDVPLLVIGHGEDFGEVQAAARGKAIELAGPRERPAVIEAMRECIGLVFPSLCFESFPMVYVEAMAAGLPVLAWQPNVLATQVVDQGTGAAVSWDDDVPEVLRRARERFPSLRSVCREAFEKELSQNAYLRRAESLYETVTEDMRADA